MCESKWTPAHNAFLAKSRYNGRWRELWNSWRRSQLLDAKGVWYPSFAEAVPEMAAEVRLRLGAGKMTRMRWLGVTQEAGWPVAQNLLLELLASRFPPTASLDVELASLDPEGVIGQAGYGLPSRQLSATYEKVAAFSRSKQSLLEQKRSSLRSLSLRLPTDMARPHDRRRSSLLVTCRPENLQYAAPQGGAEVVQRGISDAGDARLDHFEQWFAICRS